MAARELTEGLKEKIAKRASRFDPIRLVDLLESYGVHPSDVIFESNPERAGASVVDSVRFEPSGVVVIRVNLGLLGDRGALPSYFQLMLERGGAMEAFQDFIRFFDDRLVTNLLRATYPERDPELFADWSRAVGHFRRMSAITSDGLLQSVMAKMFPELRVHVKRARIANSNESASLVMGESGLDGGGLLGAGSSVEPNGFAITFVAMEASAGGGRRWPDVLTERMRERLEPILEGHHVALDVELVVVDHEEQVLLEGHGFLGYERIGGPPSAVHRVRLFRGLVGRDPIVSS
jgi:hypothetical protein